MVAELPITEYRLLGVEGTAVTIRLRFADRDRPISIVIDYDLILELADEILAMADPDYRPIIDVETKGNLL